jgi:hypothetical protein
MEPAIAKVIADLMSGISPSEMMKRDERNAGRIVLEFGDRPWFDAADWRDGAVVSVDHVNREARIVAVWARKPRHGALRKLIAGIRLEGMTTVVVEPMFNDMPSILRKWGWVRSRRGDEEQWRPRQ